MLRIYMATKTNSGLRPVLTQIRNIRIRISLFGSEIRYPRIVIWPFSGSQIRYFPDKHHRELQGACLDCVVCYDREILALVPHFSWTGDVTHPRLHPSLPKAERDITLSTFMPQDIRDKRLLVSAYPNREVHMPKPGLSRS